MHSFHSVRQSILRIPFPFGDRGKPNGERDGQDGLLASGVGGVGVGTITRSVVAL